MPEQISNNLENQESVEQTSADKLADEAVAAFEKKDFSKLDEAILRLGKEVGVELETEIEEALEKNQTTYDWLFGQGKFNLKKEYLEGNLKTFSREQQRRLERSPYTETLIIPGGIPRDEFIETVNQKYKQEFGKEIWYSPEAKTDLSQTRAAKQNPRPQTFYLIVLKPQAEAMADQEMVSKDLTQQIAVLKQKQQQNPKLNLKGLTLAEDLFFRAHLYAQEQVHADTTGFNRLLEELVLDDVGNPARALGAGWGGAGWGVGVSKLRVLSDADADSSLGARLAAVSS